MAVCAWCDQEMLSGASCSIEVFHLDGVAMPLPRFDPRGWSSDPPSRARCGDCGVRTGGAHHPGCDIARCPRCHGQLFSCGCRFDEDGPDEDEPDDD
jgi:hypothetical protein